MIAIGAEEVIAIHVAVAGDRQPHWVLLRWRRPTRRMAQLLLVWSPLTLSQLLLLQMLHLLLRHSSVPLYSNMHCQGVASLP